MEKAIVCSAPEAIRFGTDLFCAAGMGADKAETTARLLVLADMMGRRTHGLALSPLYIDQLRQNLMTPDGMPEVVRDTGASIVWDGNYLPGLWLTDAALSLAFERVETYGVVSVAIRRSHHIACLAALAKQATDRGLIAMIVNSDPAGKIVAPFGGTEPVLTPNPMAMGYPGREYPVLIDICASITTLSMVRRHVAEGKNLEHPWLMDANGVPTTDPRVIEQMTPRGSIMALGGFEYGHKGFGLGLMVEALSQGLAGHGRKEAPNRWGGNTFLQVLDPRAFGGEEAFLDEMDYTGDLCRASKPIKENVPVRLPGEQAVRNIAAAEKSGLSWDSLTWGKLSLYGKELDVRLPDLN